MKTVKTTLIVIATLAGVYFLFNLVVGVYSGVQASQDASDSLLANIEMDSKLTELGKRYSGEMVTIDSWDKATNEYLDVPLWQVYKQNEVGSLYNGEKVTLLEVDPYHSDGKNVKVKQQDGSEGYITYWYIKEFVEVRKIDPLLTTDFQ